MLVGRFLVAARLVEDFARIFNGYPMFLRKRDRFVGLVCYVRHCSLLEWFFGQGILPLAKRAYALPGMAFCPDSQLAVSAIKRVLVALLNL